MEEVHHAWGSQPVEYLSSTLLVLDDARVAELGEMTGDGGHFGSDEGGEFTDAAFAAGEFVDHEEAARVREGFEDLGLGFELGG